MEQKRTVTFQVGHKISYTAISCWQRNAVACAYCGFAQVCTSDDE